MSRLIEWDTIDLRVDGEKLEAVVRSAIGGTPPIERIALRFQDGLVRVEGTMRKVIAVPFSAEITQLIASGTTVRVPLRNVSAAGLPARLILFSILKSCLPKDLVAYEEPATLVVSLERLLPPFVSGDIQRIGIIDGGLVVTLGKGGADLRPAAEVGHGPDEVP